VITSSIESNYLHAKQFESIQVKHVAQVGLQASWLWCWGKKVYSPLDRAYRDNITVSDPEMRLMMVASIVQGLHRRLMSLHDNHHTSSVRYQPCCIRLNQGKKPLNARFSILNHEMTLQECGNAYSSQLKVAVQPRPQPEKHCSISSWLMLSPPCGPSATNHMNRLLIAVTRCHWNCYCVVTNVV